MATFELEKFKRKHLLPLTLSEKQPQYHSRLLASMHLKAEISLHQKEL